MAGFTLDCRRRSSWRSACGIARHHRWSGNVVAVPLMTPMKWYFHICMDFLLCRGDGCPAVPAGNSFLCLRYLICRPWISHCPRLGVWSLCRALAYVLVFYVGTLLSLLLFFFWFSRLVSNFCLYDKQQLDTAAPGFTALVISMSVGVHCVLGVM